MLGLDVSYIYIMHISVNSFNLIVDLNTYKKCLLDQSVDLKINKYIFPQYKKKL